MFQETESVSNSQKFRDDFSPSHRKGAILKLISFRSVAPYRYPLVVAPTVLVLSLLDRSKKLFVVSFLLPAHVAHSSDEHKQTKRLLPNLSAEAFASTTPSDFVKSI